MCLKRLFKLVFFGIAAVVLVIVFAPGLIRQGGNAFLSSVNNSTAQGISSLLPSVQGKGMDLQINVSGLNPNSAYYVTLDRAECGGQVLANVGKITTDGSGATTATLPVGDLTGIIQNTLYLDVHQGTDANGQSVACGQVQVNGAVASLSGSPTTVSATTPNKSTPTPTTSGSTSTTAGNSGDAPDTGFFLHHGSPYAGFPNTGVAPAKGNGYDNNTFPRKY